ncbi:MAG: DinB family protein [Candidatus Limnocylindrales bacterium]|nr:DinB family protein [Chloroflexota bacterium]
MVDDRRLGIEEARLGFTALAARVAAAEPWPLAESFGTAPEASWGPREVLAHMAEMLPFWLGELERIVDGGKGPVAFGRVAEDAVRIGLIERDRTLPLRVLFARVDRGLADWITRLERLTDAEARSVGLHPRLGEMTPTQIADRFVVGHAQEHVTQLESILAARSV